MLVESPDEVLARDKALDRSHLSDKDHEMTGVTTLYACREVMKRLGAHESSLGRS